MNGWTDAPNAIATVVSTRVMRPQHAVLMAAVLNAAGAFAGIEVASTIGKGIIRADLVDIQTVGAAMMGIVIWSTAAWYYGLPTSESHGLVAGLTGAALATAGPGRACCGTAGRRCSSASSSPPSWASSWASSS